MDSKFFDSLYEGDSANGVKLGMGLTGGDFWPRISGCQTLYRGDSMEQIDFANMLAVADVDACLISPPSYVEHSNNTIYFYVIRRANCCGRWEHSLSAAVKVSIDGEGNLSQPQPNDIFEAKAEQVCGDKIRLLWYYCPLEQQSQPVRFNVYYDNKSGQIDYENPIAVICYAGRKFYSYQSDTLQAGRYLFAVRAEDTGGTENNSSAQLRVQLDTATPDAIDILKAEAV
jgi:hypothetical protein